MNQYNDNIETKEECIDSEEFLTAHKEAENSVISYTIKFKQPIVYENKTFSELTFDWSRLNGRDALNIEGEMQALGKALIVPALSGEFLVRMAARACTERIGTDAICAMSISNYNKIRNAARSFLLKSEL